MSRPIPVLPDELAELLNDASPAADAASDEVVTAFINGHQNSARPQVLHGLISALRKRFEAGESRHQAAVSVMAGAMKESRIGRYTPQQAIDAIKPLFINEVIQPPRSGKQGAARTATEAESEFAGILAWAVGQALAGDLDEIRARVDEKMPGNVEWVNNLSENSYEFVSGSCDESTSDLQSSSNSLIRTPEENNAGQDDDGATVHTVPWPRLSESALYGTPGEIVKLVEPHTEADPAAILVQLLAEFGATLGSGPHFIAGNERHQAIIHPLIMGRTNNGAKGTSHAVVEAIRRDAVPTFDDCTTSGLSSAEGLIELVRDPSGDPGDEKNYDPGVSDKRLLVIESEYKSVLVRQRRDGNILGQTLRDAWDGRTLRTLTRKHNKLTATRPHIVVIGHVTPGEFRATLADSDLSGGSVNRLLICLSRRSRLNSRLGNLPADVLRAAGTKFNAAYRAATKLTELKFTEGFWAQWDKAYLQLNRDRPDCRATDATARAVTQVLRLSLLYALFDGKPVINDDHLEAALALWEYADHSARWVFSNHELEKQRETAGALANFILRGGAEGRTRTVISRQHFKGNKTAAQISAELAPLVHDGVLVEIKDETGARPITRYIHGSLRTNEITNYGRHGIDPGKNSNEFTNSDTSDIVSKFVDDSSREIGSDLHDSLNSLLRSPGNKTDTHSDPPGGITDSTHHTTGAEPALVDSHAAAPQQPAGAPTDRTPAMTPRVQQILAKVGNTRRVPGFELPTGPDRCNECGFHTPTQGHSEDCHQGAVLA